METIKVRKAYIRSLEREVLEVNRAIDILNKTEVDSTKLTKLTLYKEKLESKIKNLKDSIGRSNT